MSFERVNTDKKPANPETPIRETCGLSFQGVTNLAQTVTKKDLVRAVAGSTGITRQRALAMVNGVFTAMREQLIEGNRIEVRGFGVLDTKATKPKPAARNPRTGEVVYVPASRKTHFKPGRVLKSALHEVIE